MVANGDAWVIGESYDGNGNKQLAVAVGLARSNESRAVKVRTGKRYYSSVLRDYSDWQEKWWREAIQNAVDAGATEIICSVVPQPDGKMLVSCGDNGSGMDADTVENKFLVLGETTKESSGHREGETAGGFGKAKELLILPWIQWTVHSRNTVFTGQNEDGIAEDAPYRKGTLLSVLMPADEYTSGAAALAYIGKSSITGVRFTVIDELGEQHITRASLKVGKEIRTFGDKAVLYQNKSGGFRGTLLVRIKGLHMFTMRTSDEVEGNLVLELTRPSTELLTSNRDYFRDSGLRWAVEDFVTELAEGVRKALKSKSGIGRTLYEGSTLFSTREQELTEASLASILGEAFVDKDSKVFTIDVDLASSIADGVKDVAERQAGLSLGPTPETLKAMMNGLQVRGATHVEAIGMQAAWQPTFLIVNDDVEGFRPASKFKPDTMAPSLVKLAKLWAEFCRFVLIQLGSSEQYGVGWIFSTDAAAAYTKEKGQHFLLLNPFKGDMASSKFHSVADKDDVAWLYAAAIHEATHMADGISKHSDAFAAAITVNFAKCANKWRQVEAIRKAVVARVPKSESAGIEARTPKGSEEWLVRQLSEKLTPGDVMVLAAVERKYKAGALLTRTGQKTWIDRSYVLDFIKNEYKASYSIDRFHNRLLRLDEMKLVELRFLGSTIDDVGLSLTELGEAALQDIRSERIDSTGLKDMDDLMFNITCWIAFHQPASMVQMQRALWNNPSDDIILSRVEELKSRGFLTTTADVRLTDDPQLDALVDEVLSLMGYPGEVGKEEAHNLRYWTLSIGQLRARQIRRWFV